MIRDNITAKVEVKKNYYSSGALWYEAPFVNGQRHGMVKIYYESGALWVETPHENGKVHGVEKWYYETGALWYENPYVNGKIHGIIKKYNREKSNIDCLTLCNKDREVLSFRRES